MGKRYLSGHGRNDTISNRYTLRKLTAVSALNYLTIGSGGNRQTPVDTF